MIRRSSRQEPPEPNSSAMAAASALGHALMGNGRTVDKNKLPRYNTPSRSSSISNMRRSSMLKINSGSNQSSRSNSLQREREGQHHEKSQAKTKSVLSKRNSMILRRTSLNKPPSVNSEKRSSSLPSSTTGLIRGKGSLQEAKRTFVEFGGKQSAGTMHNHSVEQKPRTKRKYIPSRNGLIAVDVPVLDDNDADERIISKPNRQLRRSVSTSSSLRISSLKKKVSQENLHSSINNNRHSSLNNGMSGLGLKLNGTGQAMTNPLIESFVPEETEQELSKDSVLKKDTNLSEEFEKEIEKLDELLTENLELEDKIAEDEERIATKKMLNNQVRPFEINDNDEDEVTYEKKNIIKERRIPTPKSKELPTKSSQVKSRQKVQNAGYKEPISEKQLNNKKIEIISHTLQTKSPQNDLNVAKDRSDSVSQPQREVVSKSPPPRNKNHSMAQYLRESRSYLKKEKPNVTVSSPDHSKNDNNDTKKFKANTLASSTARGSSAPKANNRKDESGKNQTLKGTTPLRKVPSPIKSALKKTHTSEAKPHSHSRPSAANGAYLSMTTAENTRLNAQLTGDELGRKPSIIRTMRRPQSMNHIPKATNKQTTPVRNSVMNGNQAPKLVDQSTSAAAFASTKSAKGHMRREEQVKKQVNNKLSTEKNADSYLYPREPPQRKSSFEKLRPADTNLGFKNLSLRGDFVDTNNQTNAISQENQISLTNPISIMAEDGWHSRFQDSDSDMEENGHSHQELSGDASPNHKSKGNRFSQLFKSISHPRDIDEYEDEYDLYPPGSHPVNRRPSGLSEGTPTKIQKPFNSSGLRDGNSPTRQTKAPPINNHKFPTSMPGRESHFSSTESHESDEKKKNNLGKKLKKLFGRKKI